MTQPRLTAATLFRKTYLTMTNSFNHAVDQSLFRVLFIAGFIICFEATLYFLFHQGFIYIANFGGLGNILIQKLFSLFFLGIGVMLILSSLITVYSTMFASDEIPFLITRPFTVRNIVTYKYIESTVFASWALFFILVPFIAAYSVQLKIPLSFPIIISILTVPFIFICSGIGSLIIITCVRWFPGGKAKRIIISLISLSVVSGLIFFFIQAKEASNLDSFEMSRILPGVAIADMPFLPSYWIAESATAITARAYGKGIWLSFLLFSTAGVLYYAIDSIGSCTFYSAWQGVISGDNDKGRSPLLFTKFFKTLNFLPHDIRAIIAKDVRTFFRDPVQWSQALIFFGLLALYFLNIRTFNYHNTVGLRKITVAFLNIFSVGTVICSLGPRFVYPQMSLEGSGFWVLGLAPTTRRRILMTKLITTTIVTLFISVGLIQLSMHMLKSSVSLKLTGTLLVAIISVSTCTLSMGLGSVFINLKERNPAAIVSGFGGTLNFILCLGYMLLVMLPFAFLFHLHALEKIQTATFSHCLIMASIWAGILTISAVSIPVHLGIRNLNNREF